MRQTGRWYPGIIIYDDTQFKHNEYVFYHTLVFALSLDMHLWFIFLMYLV